MALSCIVRDIATYWSKSQNFYTPPAFSTAAGGDPVRKCAKMFVTHNTRMIGLSCGETVSADIVTVILITDGQNSGHTHNDR